MEISLKTKEDLAKMRAGGKIASRILDELKEKVRPGVTTQDLENLAADLINKAKVKASFKGFHNYPSSICVSLNEEVVHGIPGPRILKLGDIVGLDIGIFFQGFHTDTAITCPVGKISEEAEKLLKYTQKALLEGIKCCRAGHFLGDVQFTIQKTLEEAGLGVVRDLVGHGVGRDLQEAPPIPNFGKPGTGPKLKEGMTLAIEPMATCGDWHVRILDDGWTVVTVDQSLSAHFEHTIAITQTDPEILTK